MAQETSPTRQSARFAFHGVNAGYILELYDQYLADPSSVDDEARAFFANWTPPQIGSNGATTAAPAAAPADISRVLAAAHYAQNIRIYGHLAARTAPITDPPASAPELQQEQFGLTDADLEQLPAQVVDGPLVQQSRNALEAIKRLRAVYSGPIGYEFDHVQNVEQRNWLRDAVESGAYSTPLNGSQKKAILDRLTAVEAFEKFLHTTYLGAKRFSVEGTDAVVPMLDVIVDDASRNGIREIVIGMAHRGRLNVLAHVLGKPYEAIFSEFEHGPRGGVSQTDTSDIGWTGDVKYHLGLRREAGEGGGTRVDVPIIMAPNPSHLEFVDPVVEGMARASQENREESGPPTHDPMGSLPILIHGDAAFPGQGIVAETLNLSALKGYSTGGTVHIITNNQIGYTTLPQDSRSTLYASDLAKGFEIPIVHVNADDAEACFNVARLAIAYRSRFKRDFLIDLIGYRRWGHNEGDEPTFTQPEMYSRITKHPTARAIWAQKLEDEGVISAGQGDQLLAAAMDHLQQVREAGSPDKPATAEQPATSQRPIEIETAVSPGVLHQVNNSLHTFPDDFTLNPKLKRQLERRKAALETDGAIDWALAESLAFGSILMEGTPIRLTGQDAQRGTFSQRHLVLHDVERGTTFTALQSLPDAAAFAVWNSPLSESAPLGFEYGYSVYAPETLVLWEGQFGDFANGGQVIIDQFIVAGQAKWLQTSSLVLLLPHGYEGQGPEHSSGRVERFLQLAANRNIRVANCTTSAQYFHLLRRQALLLESDPRPLIIMTPKSLLRHPRAGSSLRDLTDGQFQMVIDDPVASENPDKVRRVVFCSGKVYVDLTHEEHETAEEIAIVRIELLHPFPTDKIQAVLEQYANAKEVVWLQEEPQNMGPWLYMFGKLHGVMEDMGSKAKLSYIGRPEQASPAEGSADAHAAEQARIVEAAWTLAKTKATTRR